MNQRSERAAHGHRVRLLSAAGLLAALAASSCCLVPFALFGLGVSGAWIGNLTSLAPYQPIFLGLAAVSLGAGFWLAYRTPKGAAVTACAPGSACADPRADRIARAVLWSATALFIVGMAFPWIARLVVEV